MQNATGIVSYSRYVPTLRMQRSAIAAAIGWAAPGLKTLARGRRAVANWDEDAITMAVEAGRQCLHGQARDHVAAVTLASTTFPFADRSNSGIVVDALNLKADVSNDDAGGSRRAASSALIRTLNQQPTASSSLLLASDCREARPGSTQEMRYGHAAAALLLGRTDPIAIPVASTSLHRDLVDQFRSQATGYDYALEQRWVRDEGYMKIVPEAVQEVLSKSGCQPGDIHHFALAGPAAIATALIRELQLTNADIVDPLHDDVGDSGVAQPIMLLGKALAQAEPGQNILLAGFGQGADALIFTTTDKIRQTKARDIFQQSITQARDEHNYLRYLVLRQRLRLDYGIRAERDNRTALSALYRRCDAISRFSGGRCQRCGMLQFPRSAVCVRCHEAETQQPESLAELNGRVKSFTEDWQAHTPCPPLIYGNVTFPDGANVMMEFTDFAAGELAVDQEVRMVFRIKDYDERRGFRRYFWKSAPVAGTDG